MSIIDDKILDSNKSICKSIELLDDKNHGVDRGYVAEQVLRHSRNLVEYIFMKVYSQKTGKDIGRIWTKLESDNKQSLKYVKNEQKCLMMVEFHKFLQLSTSHYPHDDDGAERLMLRYFHYYLYIRDFMWTEYRMEVLQNLEKFLEAGDKSIDLYNSKIAEKLDVPYERRDISHEARMYIHKVVPFCASGKVYYAVTLMPAYDTTSKFDRFICYSSRMIPHHYAIKADIRYERIEVHGKQMPIAIMVDCIVSIRPSELNNYSKLFGLDTHITANHSEYVKLMSYLSGTGESLLDIILSEDSRFDSIKNQIFDRSKYHQFRDVLDRSRELILKNEPGCNILRYLLHTMNNKVIKSQRNNMSLDSLSGLFLKWGCIPFDTMPFASSLINHNPTSFDLNECIDVNGHEDELIVRYINVNMSTKGILFTHREELERYTGDRDIEDQISRFNSRLYYKHEGRTIRKYKDYFYKKEAYDQTKSIIETLKKLSEEGVMGYESSIKIWIDDNSGIDCDEKKHILQKMFSKTHVSLIYGAAGTGKTHLLNYISQFFSEHSKLYLANTNSAVENLRRKIKTQNCKFMTIKKALLSKGITDFDVLIIDECSMVSNSDMYNLLNKVSFKLMILVGDIYQIASISFGNWFALAKRLLPKHTVHELKNPYRTKDSGLLGLWEKVRLWGKDKNKSKNEDADLPEYMAYFGYSKVLDDSVFEKEEEDEIILCLNYDGVYGINNINRLLQENNRNIPFKLGVWSFKVGDPILFNESERFAPALYNNLKGVIKGIVEDEHNDCLLFEIEVEKSLTELDSLNCGFELVRCEGKGKSVIRFPVYRKKESDNDNGEADETDIPFQIAYAVSIHKAQGLEYDSVKVVISNEVEERITHNIFYTAITRAKKCLRIYWDPESQEKVLSKLLVRNIERDMGLFKSMNATQER